MTSNQRKGKIQRLKAMQEDKSPFLLYTDPGGTVKVRFLSKTKGCG